MPPCERVSCLNTLMVHCLSGPIHATTHKLKIHSIRVYLQEQPTLEKERKKEGLI